MKGLKLNGSIISNSSELSNAFNDHFSAIGPRLANKIPPNDNNNDFSYINNTNINNNKFRFSSTSSGIVFSHLNKLCRPKATSLDNICAKIIRECADLLLVRCWRTRERLCLHQVKSLLRVHCMLLADSFEPRPNRCELVTAGSVMTIGL